MSSLFLFNISLNHNSPRINVYPWDIGVHLFYTYDKISPEFKTKTGKDVNLCNLAEIPLKRTNMDDLNPP